MSDAQRYGQAPKGSEARVATTQAVTDLDRKCRGGQAQ